MTEEVRREQRSRLWFSRAGIAAMALLFAQFLWRGHYLWGGYYFQDDFNMLRIGGESDLTLDFLMQPYSGHVWPGNFLIAWIAARVDPTSWTLTATTVLLMQAACGAMMWVVLSRITQDWRIRLPLLLAYLVCPLTLWATQWWASAIGFVPLSFFMLVAVWGLMRRIQDDWRAGSVVAVLAFQSGLLFQERALLYTVLLGGVAVVMTEGRLDRRVLQALRSYWALWLGLVVVLASWLTVHNAQTPLEVSGNDEGQGPLALMRDYLFRNLLPGLAGGPWGNHSAGEMSVLHPSTAAAVIGSVVTLGGLLLLARRTGATGRVALLLLVVYSFMDLFLIYGGRAQFEGVMGLVPRYTADVAPVACLAVACALADLRSALPARAAFARRSAPWVVAATLTYAASAVLTTANIAPMQQGQVAKDYVATLEAQLRRHPDSVIYDRPAPDDVMINWFGDEGRISTVLAHAPQKPVFDVMSENLLVPNDQGVLEEPRLLFTEELWPETGDDCGYRVGPADVPVRIDAPDDGFQAWWVVRFTYYTSAEVLVRVSTEEETAHFLAQEGAHSAALVLTKDSDHLEIEWERGEALVCVTGVETGFPAQVWQ